MLGSGGVVPQTNLVIDCPLNGTLNNLLNSQYAVAVGSGAAPTFVTDGGRQVYQNTTSGQTNARALEIRENTLVELTLGSYVIEFEFSLNSLTNNQAILAITQNHISGVVNMVCVQFYNGGSGSFRFGVDGNTPGSVLTTSGNIALQANIWYRIRFESHPFAGNVTVNGQTLSYTITGIRTHSGFFVGSRQNGWWGNPINGKIKDLKMWKI